MSCRKRRGWHFRDPKFKNFLLGEHAPRLPQVWGAFGAVAILPCVHLQNLTPRCQLRYLIACEITNKPFESNGHTTQLRGVASTLRMRQERINHSLLHGQLFVGAHQHGIANGPMKSMSKDGRRDLV